jgi:hypothetical protein
MRIKDLAVKKFEFKAKLLNLMGFGLSSAAQVILEKKARELGSREDSNHGFASESSPTRKAFKSATLSSPIPRALAE